MDVDSMTRAKARAMIARARRKETARASSPRKREERDSKVTAETVVNGGIDRKTVGRNMESK